MQAKELRTIYRAQPFQPFVVHLADGRAIPVKHQEFMALSPAGRSAVVYGEDGGFEVIDILLITGLEVTNARRKSRRKK